MRLLRAVTFLLSLTILFAIAIPALAQKKTKERDSEETGTSSKYDLDGSRNSCSCRGLQGQIDFLELRLDRMIDLWNDFVDKNRNPYEQEQYPGGSRRPPPRGMGGRGPNPYQERPGSGGNPPRRAGSERFYDMRTDGYGYDQTPRRFRF